MDNLLIQNVYSELKDTLNTIYKKRKHTLFFQKIMWLITGLFFLLMLVNMGITWFPNSEIPFLRFFTQFQPTPTNPYANTYPFIGLVVLIYLSTYFFSNTFQKFILAETKTISKMVQQLFPKVEFSQGVKAPINEITNSKLFAWINKKAPIYSYGQIRSSINNVVINIADIGIIEENLSNKFLAILMRVPVLNMFAILYQYVFKNIFTNKLSDNRYYTFRGMFCWLNFKKKLNGHTVILTNNQHTKLDRFASFKFTDEHKINLEDPRFTSQFIVYSTDQVEARYVLSIALMERISALKAKFNQPMLLSFHNQQMYIAIENTNGLFSFPSKRIDNLKIIEELANDIETALKIATELNLK